MADMYPHPPGSNVDDWADQPPQSGFHKWIMGSLFPAALVLYGLNIMVTRVGRIPGRYGAMAVHGPNATAYGLSIVAIAVFSHCHYFWGNIYNQAWFAVLGKILSLIAFIVSTGYLMVEMGVLGKK